MRSTVALAVIAAAGLGVSAQAQFGGARRAPITSRPGLARPGANTNNKPRQIRRISLLRLSPALEARLKITPEQHEKLVALSERLRQGTVRTDGEQPTGQDRGNRLKTLREAQLKAEAEAEALLSAEQKKLLEQLRRDADLYPGLGRYGLALLALPDLTEAQRGKLRDLSNQMIQQRQKMVAGFKSAPGNAGQLSDQLKAVDGETLTNIQALLTPAQQKELKDAMRYSRSRRPRTAAVRANTK
jgi:hypothetical protein